MSLPIILLPVYRPKTARPHVLELSSHQYNGHRRHHPLYSRPRRGPLVTFRANPPNTLPTFQTSRFRHCARCATLPSRISRIPSCHQRNGARLTRVVRRHSPPNNESSSSFGGRGSAAYLSLIFTVQCRSTEGEDEELCPGQISHPVDPYLWTRRSVWLYNSVPPSHIQSRLGRSSNPISPAAS